MEKTTDLKLEELSKEQILDLADAAGRKLGFLIATSPLDDDLKMAIIGILDSATPEQLHKLSQILEWSYFNASQSVMNEFIKSELEAIESGYRDRRAILEGETLGKLNKLFEGK